MYSRYLYQGAVGDRLGMAKLTTILGAERPIT
eukprot:SAG11_NODE_2763_length_3000_cov_2.151672_3_plen_31_part_01